MSKKENDWMESKMNMQNAIDDFVEQSRGLGFDDDSIKSDIEDALVNAGVEDN